MREPRAGAVLRATLSNPPLRRVALAFAGFHAAEYGVWVAILVYAYDQGGATAAGLVAVAQLLPAAVCAPLASGFADRHPPGRVLALGYALQTLTIGATATLVALDAPPGAVYAGAIVAASAITLTRPAQAALLPTLVAGPAELTGANALTGWLESASILAGPAIAGVMLGVGGVEAAVGVFAGFVAVSTLLALGVPGSAAAPAAQGEHDAEGIVAAAAGGLRTVASLPGSGSLVGLLALQFVLIGALDVLAVVLALGVLDLGESGAGYLSASFGAGGLLGAALALSLVGRRGLVAPMLVAALAWSIAFSLVGVWETVAGAFVLIAAAGVARTLLDVAGRTLLQRAAPAEALARVFGLLEGMLMLALAAGSILAPVLVNNFSAGVAFAVCGLLMPVVALLRLRALRRIDSTVHAPVAELAALRRCAIFAPLPAPELEGLATSLEPVEATAGTAVIRRGDVGDRFYLVEEGSLTAHADGVELAELGPGDSFGEIALLRDVARTATVEAATDVRLWALGRAPFLAAVTNHVGARAAADAVTDERLGRELVG
ncbi:MAG TPA: MFS transporter [Solirubrobacterales bacterium]|nr:MFS transporter [Solirubrobacterales bacterium]